ncbi:MFS transporter [Chryseobacterium sp.]|uniref:MFS transporter n=1 Tax=Chryseobacterium sp. TaxID=1871047 RepID=UPI0028976841|nr:MFS transporter [Chryseobacterium sp.]
MKTIFRHSSISLPLKLTFLIFSMVLNCMGIIILQLSDEKVNYNKLSFLESFKDIPIAFISLFAVSFISRYGTKKSLIFSMLLVGFCSVILPFVEVFWFYKVWFAIIGTCFAIGKICVYGIIRNNFLEEKEMAKTMNSVEASYMVGIFAVNMGFGLLISSRFGEFWKFGFSVIAALSFFTAYLFSIAKIKEPIKAKTKLIPNLSGFGNMTIILFIAVIFFIVFTERSFNSWLPAFYKDHLKVDSFFALQSTSFLAVFSYIGRIITSKVIHRFTLEKYFTACVIGIIAVLLTISYIQLTFPENSGVLVYIFPLIGLFLAPLYPVVNSKMMAKIDKDKINTFTSLIVIFSSLGSAFSSMIIAILFEDKILNFYSLYVLLAVLIILIFSVIYFRVSKEKN